MKPSIQSRLSQVEDRFEEISMLLSQMEVMADQNRFRDLSREYSQLEPVVALWKKWKALEDSTKDLNKLLNDSDPAMKEMAREELAENLEENENLERQLRLLLLPRDPDDDSNIFLEIRAGTGGDEAALFSGDLFRMYARYAEKHKWKIDVLTQSLGEHGGYKEVIARVAGRGVFSRLKFESGTHRVQRVEMARKERVHRRNEAPDRQAARDPAEERDQGERDDKAGKHVCADVGEPVAFDRAKVGHDVCP